MEPNTGSVAAMTPLLNLLSGTARAAYSLRKLRSGYAGKAINVRRSSDNATQDIGFTVYGDLDLTALLAFVGNNDGFVATWYDQTGNATNLTAVSGQQPRIVASGVVEVTPIDGTPALNFGWPANLVTLGTNNIYLNSSGGLSFAQGDSIFVHSLPYGGPGILSKNNGNKPTAAADVLYQTVGAFQILGTDQQGQTPGSNPYPNDDNEPVCENNLTGVQGSSGTNTNIKITYGGPNTQVNWMNFSASNSQILLGFQTSTATGDSWPGYVMEVIINGSGTLFSSSDKAIIFSNQSAYYHIDISKIADAVNEQMTTGYSTRKLRKGYTGFCLKVRRDSDNATKDIGFVAGNLDTLGLVNFVTSNGANPAANGYVTTWYDQGVWANIFSTNAVQATNANQPQIVLNGAVITQNGRPVLWFNQGIGGSVSLQSVAGSGATSGSWAGVIAKYTGTLPFPNTNFPTSVANFTTAWQAVFQGAQNTGFWQSNFSGSVSVNNGANVATNNLEQDVILGGPVNQMAFGHDPGIGNSSWQGYIGEFVSFTSTMPASDITVLYNNQKSWWGTP